MKKEYIKSVGKSICSRCKKVFGNAVIYCLSCDAYSIREMTNREQKNHINNKIIIPQSVMGKLQ